MSDRNLGRGKKDRSDLPENPKRAGLKPAREAAFRKKPGRNPGRTMAAPRKLSPLARLIHTLRAEKIRFQVVGMSGAILQGAPATTLDTDLWIDLPSRQYIRVLNICRRLGATLRANTVVDLSDGSTVNFLYEVHGIRSFDSEYRRAKRIKWLQTELVVLPLERI